MPLPQPSADGEYLVIVPVGGFDLRAVLALRHAAGVPHSSVRALHLCADGDAAHAFALRWATGSGNSFAIPLDIIESPPDRWAERFRTALEVHCQESTGRVMVVIGRLRLRRRWHRLLHDRSAEKLRRALVGIHNVHIEFVDVPV